MNDLHRNPNFQSNRNRSRDILGIMLPEEEFILSRKEFLQIIRKIAICS